MLTVEEVDVGMADPTLGDDALFREAHAGLADTGLGELADEAVDAWRGALVRLSDEDRKNLAVEGRRHRPKGMPEFHVLRVDLARTTNMDKSEVFGRNVLNCAISPGRVGTALI